MRLRCLSLNRDFHTVGIFIDDVFPTDETILRAISLQSVNKDIFVPAKGGGRGDFDNR